MFSQYFDLRIMVNLGLESEEFEEQEREREWLAIMCSWCGVYFNFVKRECWPAMWCVE
jgi:hypothetical protein